MSFFVPQCRSDEEFMNSCVDSLLDFVFHFLYFFLYFYRLFCFIPFSSFRFYLMFPFLFLSFFFGWFEDVWEKCFAPFYCMHLLFDSVFGDFFFLLDLCYLIE